MAFNTRHGACSQSPQLPIHINFHIKIDTLSPSYTSRTWLVSPVARNDTTDNDSPLSIVCLDSDNAIWYAQSMAPEEGVPGACILVKGLHIQRMTLSALLVQPWHSLLRGEHLIATIGVSQSNSLAITSSGKPPHGSSASFLHLTGILYGLTSIFRLGHGAFTEDRHCVSPKLVPLPSEARCNFPGCIFSML